MPFQFRKESIEEDLNRNFPSQGQGNPPLYYSLSEVVVPTYSINTTAEGSGLPESLQTAWDFSTGSDQVNNSNQTIISNTGFWQVNLTCVVEIDAPATGVQARVYIDDGASEKNVWGVSSLSGGTFTEIPVSLTTQTFVVFLRSTDELKAQAVAQAVTLDLWYRQIADVNGNLVNPLGFSFA